MARLELRPSNGEKYVVVVVDEKHPDGWKKRTVKSFGNVKTRRALVAAAGFADATGWPGLGDMMRRHADEAGRS